jgi:putative transposase
MISSSVAFTRFLFSDSTKPGQSQYTSQGYLAVLKEAEIQVSMSKKGDGYENALMDSCFGTLKEEGVERQIYQTRAEARSSVFE